MRMLRPPRSSIQLSRLHSDGYRDEKYDQFKLLHGIEVSVYEVTEMVWKREGLYVFIKNALNAANISLMLSNFIQMRFWLMYI